MRVYEIFDKKLLDLILVGEYFILVAVYLILCLLVILSDDWDKSWFFLLVVSLLFLPGAFLRRCTKVFLGSVLLVKIENFPLLKLFLVLLSFNCSLSIEFEYEVFRLKSRLLLTSSKQLKFALTIENLICPGESMRFD